MPSLLQTLEADVRFRTMLALLKDADLVDMLSGDEALTVFAPSDEAFDKLPEGTIATLVQQPQDLQALLKYHLVEGDVRVAQLNDTATLTSLAGPTLELEPSDPPRVGRATILNPDILAENGVIHGLDYVLTPVS
ncbi:MAG: fasciclin domain-containing protein [Trueperaceae bacterium]|nr:fasciclin domain-containing protein [Trueperaceae bacterium]